jgi:hypothetical protein
MEKYTSTVREDDNTYVLFETTIVHCDSLLEAMRVQVAKNKEICDEIIRKADNFEKELKDDK